MLINIRERERKRGVSDQKLFTFSRHRESFRRALSSRNSFLVKLLACIPGIVELTRFRDYIGVRRIIINSERTNEASPAGGGSINMLMNRKFYGAANFQQSRGKCL